MKLYEVTVTGTIIVLAEDESGALRAAQEAIENNARSELDLDPRPLKYLPHTHTGHELPWIDPRLKSVPEKTIDLWIDDGCAPGFVGRAAKLEKW